MSDGELIDFVHLFQSQNTNLALWAQNVLQPLLEGPSPGSATYLKSGGCNFTYIYIQHLMIGKPHEPSFMNCTYHQKKICRRPGADPTMESIRQSLIR